MLDEKSQVIVALFEKKASGHFKYLHSYVENFVNSLVVQSGDQKTAIEESENILKIAPMLINGFTDIILQKKGTTKPIHIYKWHKNLKQYQ